MCFAPDSVRGDRNASPAAWGRCQIGGLRVHRLCALWCGTCGVVLGALGSKSGGDAPARTLGFCSIIAPFLLMSCRLGTVVFQEAARYIKGDSSTESLGVAVGTRRWLPLPGTEGRCLSGVDLV